jgi:hypothetical protein
MAGQREANRQHGTVSNISGRQKKHHFISAFVLRNFTSAGKTLAVQPIDGRERYFASTDDVGQKTMLIERPSLTPRREIWKGSRPR